MESSRKPDPAITSQFLASTIHEVRTPIQTIIGTLELLEETKLDPEQTEYVRQIQFGADVLLSLANDILDFSKIRSGKFDIEKIPINTLTITEQTVDLLCIEAHNRGLEIVTDIDYTIAPTVLGDPIRIQQVLLNLTKNAVKFTHKGYVRVRLSQQKNNSILLFEVQDSGIGIPIEKQKNIFNDFYQVDASTTRKYGGSGLGLSISKGLVASMGGKIGMKTNPSGGSVFWFCIPLVVPNKDSLLVEIENKPNLLPKLDIPENASILLVDDQTLALRSLYSKLKILNVKHIDMVTSGEQALVKMKAAAKKGKPYTLALIDMLMPSMDGWRLSAEIVDNKAINATKLYLMVPEGQMGGEAKMKMLDWFDGYLYKPIKFHMLQEMLHSHFNAPLELEVIDAIEELPSVALTANKTDTFKVDGKTILVAEDHPINQKLMKTFLLKFGASVVTASNGQEAIDCIQENKNIDIIFMDIQMPIKTGIEAGHGIRELGYEGIIIACTANTDVSDFEFYLENGMNDILTKPFKRADLQKMLEKWLPFNQTTTSDIPEPLKLESTVSLKNVMPKEFWDMEDFMDTVGGDKHLAKELIKQYLTQTSTFLSSAKKAQVIDDYASLTSIGHTLKGSSATLSLIRLAKIGSDLEKASKQKDLRVIKISLVSFIESFAEFEQYVHKTYADIF